MTRAQMANRRRMAVIERLVREAKNVPCADCGIRYPYYVMEFDHIRGTKSFGIACNYQRVSVGRMREEIAKCDVVCANCHREREHGRREESKVTEPLWVMTTPGWAFMETTNGNTSSQEST